MAFIVFTSELISDVYQKQQYLLCAVLILTGDCDFESKYLCDWFNDEENDEFDWRVISGKTGSTGTGPTSDHTTNSTTGIKFMCY